jgi:hypothetical protein
MTSATVQRFPVVTASGSPPNSRQESKPAQRAAGIEPLRRVYDLRHTFATFALRAGISTFDLSPLHGRKPDHDRPTLRPPRARRTRTRDPPARTERRTTATVDAAVGGVDVHAASTKRASGFLLLSRCFRCLGWRLTDSNRRPLLTIFGLFPRFLRPADLPVLATGCACWAP